MLVIFIFVGSLSSEARKVILDSVFRLQIVSLERERGSGELPWQKVITAQMQRTIGGDAGESPGDENHPAVQLSCCSNLPPCVV